MQIMVGHYNIILSYEKTIEQKKINKLTQLFSWVLMDVLHACILAYIH